MKFYENMFLGELERERATLQAKRLRLQDTQNKLDGTRDYEDAVGKAFPLGVGFRPDTKRYHGNIDRRVNRAVKSNANREELELTIQRLGVVESYIQYITSSARPTDVTRRTVKELKEEQKQAALATVADVKWVCSKSSDGFPIYSCGVVVIKSVDGVFFLNVNGCQYSYYHKLGEAKKVGAVLVRKHS